MKRYTLYNLIKDFGLKIEVQHNEVFRYNNKYIELMIPVDHVMKNKEELSGTLRVIDDSSGVHLYDLYGCTPLEIKKMIFQIRHKELCLASERR